MNRNGVDRSSRLSIVAQRRCGGGEVGLGVRWYLFVDRVTEKSPHSPAVLKAEFTEFCSALDADLREPLANFVSGKLSADPDTAWMAEIISSNDAAKDKAYAVLEEIKANNAGLHDKSVRKGGFIGFSCNGEGLELADVLGKLEAGETVSLTLAKWAKASGWAIAGAICLGGSWPTCRVAHSQQR